MRDCLPKIRAPLTKVIVHINYRHARDTRSTFQRGETERFTQHAGRELAQLMRADYVRLTAILRRCLASEPSLVDGRG